MSLHRCLVPVACAGAVQAIDSIVEYDGPPAWHLEPIDLEARSIWERETANPEKAKAERDRFLGYPDFDFFDDHPCRQKREPTRPAPRRDFNFFAAHPGRATERRT